MPTNPYFNFTLENSEQTLVEDLITEAIQIYGHSAFYIPREDVNVDRLFGEDPLASFDHAFEIELYMKASTQFGGNGTLMSKFGITIEDTATFLVSMRRFNQVLGTRMARPREGDIIYLSFFGPAWRYLFEVRYVHSTEQLFQLGKLYTYELKCESFNYSHERVKTGIPEVNRIAEREAYTQTMVLDGQNGSGDFIVGESIYQGFVGAPTGTGTVAKWDNTTFTLSVQNIVGTFDLSSNGGDVVGNTSGASYPLANVVENSQVPVPINDTPKNLEPSPFDISDNDTIQTDGPSVVVPIHNPRYNQ